MTQEAFGLQFDHDAFHRREELLVRFNANCKGRLIHQRVNVLYFAIGAMQKMTREGI